MVHLARNAPAPILVRCRRCTDCLLGSTKVNERARSHWKVIVEETAD